MTVFLNRGLIISVISRIRRIHGRKYAAEKAKKLPILRYALLRMVVIIVASHLKMVINYFTLIVL